MPTKQSEEWNENVEKCSGCGIEWKKIGKQCPVCFAPAEKHIKKIKQSDNTSSDTREGWREEFYSRFCFTLLNRKVLYTNKDQTDDMLAFISQVKDEAKREERKGIIRLLKQKIKDLPEMINTAQSGKLEMWQKTIKCLQSLPTGESEA